MALQDLDLSLEDRGVPEDVHQILLASQSGVRRYLGRDRKEVSGFVPSDPELVYCAGRSVT